MNAAMSLLPANQRIISIEDTREINLPEYPHWVPLTTREPNNERQREIAMLDLLINSLRMRPDYIIVGEVRRGQRQRFYLKPSTQGTLFIQHSTRIQGFKQ